MRREDHAAVCLVFDEEHWAMLVTNPAISRAIAIATAALQPPESHRAMGSGRAVEFYLVNALFPHDEDILDMIDELRKQDEGGGHTEDHAFTQELMKSFQQAAETAVAEIMQQSARKSPFTEANGTVQGGLQTTIARQLTTPPGAGTVPLAVASFLQTRERR